MLISLILLLILSSAFFSGSEAALLRLRHSKVAADSKKSFLAKITSHLLTKMDMVLPMILLGNTFANILVGSLLSSYLLLQQANNTILIIAPFVLSLIILIFAEILPKTLATLYADKIAYLVSPLISLLFQISKPITLFLAKLNEFLLKTLGVPTQTNGDFITHEEYKVMIEQGSNLNKEFHHSLMMGILELNDLDVNNIMTTRNNIDIINIQTSLESIKSAIKNSNKDNLVVVDGNIDRIIGTLKLKIGWRLLLSNSLSLIQLKNALDPPYFIPENISLPKQWQQFQNNEQKVAIVVNEFGETQGVLTKNDIVQEIFVNSQSNDFNTVELGIAKITENQWIISGSTSCHHIKKLFKWPLLDLEADTIGGSITNYLETIPQQGACIKKDNVIYEVLKADQHKIIKVKVTVIAKKKAVE